MATKSTVPTVANGDSWSAAQQNTYLRDNIEAVWPYTMAGDIAYASAANQLNRLALGSGYKFLRNGVSAPEWGGFQYCLAYHSTTQSLANATPQALVFDSDSVDASGWHSTVSNTSRITVTETGYYQAACHFVYTGAGGSGTYYDTIEMRINGTVGWQIRQWVEISALSKLYGPATTIFALSAGQYVEWFVQQNSGGARTVAAFANTSLLRIG